MTAPVQPQPNAPAGAPAPGGAPPVQTALLPPKMPWTPFAPMPTDDEPAIAQLRRRRLERLIDSAKFEGMAPEWQQVAIAEYQRMRTVESQAAAAQLAAEQPAPKPGQQQQPPKPQPGGTP